MGWRANNKIGLRPRAGSEVVPFKRVDSENTAVPPCQSIKLNYPKNRILLGTMAHVQNRGVHKALDTSYPLELSIECNNLPLPKKRFLARHQLLELRPFCVIYFRNPRGGAWELMGRTETVLYDEYTRFVTKLKLSCSTVADRLKEIRVQVYDRRTPSDDLREQYLIGSAECSLDDVVSEALLRKELSIRRFEKEKGGVGADLGDVVLSADVLRPLPTPVGVQFDVEMGSSTKEDKRMFYVISRQIRSGDYTPVYRSEVLGPEDKKFSPVNRSLGAITAGVEAKLLRFELFQFDPRGNHYKLGYMQTSITKLREAEVSTHQLWWPAYNDVLGVIDVGRVVLVARKIDEGSLRFKFRFTQ